MSDAYEDFILSELIRQCFTKETCECCKKKPRYRITYSCMCCVHYFCKDHMEARARPTDIVEELEEPSTENQ